MRGKTEVLFRSQSSDTSASKKRAITADTDLRLARFFGMSEGYFLGLQTDFDLMERRREIEDQLLMITPRAASAGNLP